MFRWEETPSECPDYPIYSLPPNSLLHWHCGYTDKLGDLGPSGFRSTQRSLGYLKEIMNSRRLNTDREH